VRRSIRSGSEARSGYCGSSAGWKSGRDVRLFKFGICESASAPSVSLLTWRSVQSDDKLAFRMHGYNGTCAKLNNMADRST